VINTCQIGKEAGMSEKSEVDKFLKSFEKRNRRKQLKVIKTVKVLVAFDTRDSMIPPVTAEDWEKLPILVKWRILWTIVFCVLRSKVAGSAWAGNSEKKSLWFMFFRK
jgi:hypothetical protein